MNRLTVARRHAQIAILRALPLRARWKRWLVWLLLPRFTVGVAAVIQDERGRVLMLRSAWHGGWQLPGGAVNYGERFDDAMRRETLEETGVRVAALERLLLTNDRSGRQLHVLYRAALGPGRIRLSEEHTAWQYREIDGLPPAARQAAERAGPHPPSPSPTAVGEGGRRRGICHKCPVTDPRGRQERHIH